LNTETVRSDASGSATVTVVVGLNGLGYAYETLKLFGSCADFLLANKLVKTVIYLKVVNREDLNMMVKKLIFYVARQYYS